jgi:hypothetical protein
LQLSDLAGSVALQRGDFADIFSAGGLAGAVV